MNHEARYSDPYGKVQQNNANELADASYEAHLTR